jgi:hypothetical protein
MSEFPIVPRRSKEAIAADARHCDVFKVATANLDLGGRHSINIEGVHLNSRYDDALEYELLLAMVLRLPERLRSKIASINCDSKGTWVFSAILKTGNWYADTAEEIADQLEAVALRLRGGHNGIRVEADENDLRLNTDLSIVREADWSKRAFG